MSAALWGIALLSACFFGLALVLTQFGLRRLPALQGAAVAIPAATILCWCIIPFLVDWNAWKAEPALIFAAVGLFFPACVTIMTYEANRRMGPTVAGAIGNLAPLFAVLFAWGILDERITLPMGAAIAAIVAGVMLIGVRRDAGAAPRWPLWLLVLPLMAAIVRGIVQPVVKVGLGGWDSPLAAVGIGYLVSSLVVLAAAARRGGLPALVSDLKGAAWFAVVGVCNILAVLTLYAALALGPVTLVSPIVASYPLVTVLLGWMLLRQQRPGPATLLGVAVTTAGIILLMAVG